MPGSGLRYDVEYPDTRAVAQDQIASDMGTTVKDWALTDYYTFGPHLGKMPRESMSGPDAAVCGGHLPHRDGSAELAVARPRDHREG